MRRVVVTGMGGVSGLGEDWENVKANFAAGKTAIRYMEDWDKYEEMNTRLAGPVPDFSIKGRYPRKKMRSMGPVSEMSVYASELALRDAGLIDEKCALDEAAVNRGRIGVSYGSSFGSTEPVMAFGNFFNTGNMGNLTATSYIRMMSHTSAVNISTFFGLQGRTIPTSTACTSGSLGIGYAYEAIKFGLQDVMVSGGAEELCPSMAVVFDSLFATSTKNETPELSPRPFDKDRDGLVIGEGAGTLVLEEYEHAKARGAKIYAEIVGFGSNSDGNHITQPTKETMEQALRLSLANAGLEASDIGIINGHGTATYHGDIAESHATYDIFGSQTAYHTLKGYFGHSLGACGALEAWMGIHMMLENWYAPIANLTVVDEACADLDYIMGAPRELDVEFMMSNNFAFGGINSSLIFKKI